jgi:hypothetical protein
VKKDKPPQITEKVWLAQVRGLARALGWRVYHTFLSKWSEYGFPDLTLVRTGTTERPPRLIFVELKSENGRVSPKQQEWLDLLRSVGGNVEVYVWRASDFDEVVRILR